MDILPMPSDASMIQCKKHILCSRWNGYTYFILLAALFTSARVTSAISDILARVFVNRRDRFMAMKVSYQVEIRNSQALEIQHVLNLAVRVVYLAGSPTTTKIST